MFIQMLNSLPKQTLWARNHDSEHDRQPANVQSKLIFISDMVKINKDRCS